MEDVERILHILSTIAEGIGETFGRNCEVVVHDLRNLDHTVVKIVNGHVTGRKVGSSISDLGLKQLRSKTNQELFLNYQSKNKSGKPLKSTTICLRDDEGNPIAGLCINLDISNIMASMSFIEEICKAPASEPEVEIFQKDIKNTLRGIIKKTIQNFGKDFHVMDKNDKMKFIESLDKQGVFLIKGAVNLIAKEMNVSRFTIYNYLGEIRSDLNMPFVDEIEA